MSDLISRQAAIDALNEKCLMPVWCKVLVKKMLTDLPSAEPERKMGKWKIKTINTFNLAYGSTGYEPVYECSVCGAVEESYLRLDEPIMPEDADFPNYCPNCGAEMKGEADDRD